MNAHQRVTKRKEGGMWRGALASIVGLWILVMGGHVARGALPAPGDLAVEAAMQEYLNGVDLSMHGVWLESLNGVLVEHQGTVPLPVASLTKVATSLAALRAWGPQHQFATLIDAAGTIQGGVLYGDLLVQGGGDPYLVWEDAIAIGRSLQQLGIRRVTGRLVITGNFFMSYTMNPAAAGKMLKQALDAKLWPAWVRRNMQGTPPEDYPHITIAGPVAVPSLPPARQMPLLRHRSLPLVHILKRMNVYSNNAMAEMLAEMLGGAQNVAQHAASAARVSVDDIQVINGSGLGAQNQLSARTVCALFAGIHSLVSPARLTVADIFPVAGYDRGTIRRRNLPLSTVVKTGTLRNVSTLAGVMMTRTHGPVWFALLNQGNNLPALRARQDALLQNLSWHWGTVESPPMDLAPIAPVVDTTRNDILVTRLQTNGG